MTLTAGPGGRYQALLAPPPAETGGVVAGLAGSLRKGGAVGAAHAARENRIPARRVAVYGSPSSGGGGRGVCRGGRAAEI